MSGAAADLSAVAHLIWTTSNANTRPSIRFRAVGANLHAVSTGAEMVDVAHRARSVSNGIADLAIVARVAVAVTLTQGSRGRMGVVRTGVDVLVRAPVVAEAQLSTDDQGPEGQAQAGYRDNTGGYEAELRRRDGGSKHYLLPGIGRGVDGIVLIGGSGGLNGEITVSRGPDGGIVLIPARVDKIRGNPLGKCSV